VRIIAACALVVLFATSAVADGTILTCTNLDGQDFTASGGIGKPGWSVIAPSKFKIKLAFTNHKWDIIRIDEGWQDSALNNGCSVSTYHSATVPLDRLIIVACKDEIETMLFYVRDGQDKLITTIITSAAGLAGAAITETADCHKGD
jgi:hypothetical protein